MNYIPYICAGVISGIFASMGVGGNGILIMYLTLFLGMSQRMSQGIGLFFFIPVAAVSTVIYVAKKLIVWKIAVPCILIGVIGSFLGFYLGGLIDQKLLSKIFGGIFLITGITQFIKK
ncbi:MAG: sulfite exporter TauE/SafE family protein [Oscillospiraceae bacterium]|jgi:uncharacterized membrane protein YfcA|nr:sulfite exporter TauE/SafE family protein [Oscillospiraceae bacterium]